VPCVSLERAGWLSVCLSAIQSNFSFRRLTAKVTFSEHVNVVEMQIFFILLLFKCKINPEAFLLKIVMLTSYIYIALIILLLLLLYIHLHFYKSIKLKNLITFRRMIYMLYDMIYVMVYLLTVTGLKPSGSTMHRTTQ
jgi:hypothetical protein